MPRRIPVAPYDQGKWEGQMMAMYQLKQAREEFKWAKAKAAQDFEQEMQRMQQAQERIALDERQVAVNEANARQQELESTTEYIQQKAEWQVLGRLKGEEKDPIKQAELAQKQVDIGNSLLDAQDKRLKISKQAYEQELTEVSPAIGRQLGVVPTSRFANLVELNPPTEIVYTAPRGAAQEADKQLLAEQGAIKAPTTTEQTAQAQAWAAKGFPAFAEQTQKELNLPVDPIGWEESHSESFRRGMIAKMIGAGVTEGFDPYAVFEATEKMLMQYLPKPKQEEVTLADMMKLLSGAKK